MVGDPRPGTIWERVLGGDLPSSGYSTTVVSRCRRPSPLFNKRETRPRREWTTPVDGFVLVTNTPTIRRVHRLDVHRGPCFIIREGKHTVKFQMSRDSIKKKKICVVGWTFCTFTVTEVKYLLFYFRVVEQFQYVDPLKFRSIRGVVPYMKIVFFRVPEENSGFLWRMEQWLVLQLCTVYFPKSLCPTVQY